MSLIAKEYRPIVRHLLRQGWTARKRGRTGHLKLVAPGGRPTLIISGTPSDHRSYTNFIHQVRRAGVTWPPSDSNDRDLSPRH